MAKEIIIGGKLHSAAVGNILADASEILDETQNKKQSDINAEVADTLAAHEQGIANAGKVDTVKVNGIPVVDENKEANINITASVVADDTPGDPTANASMQEGNVNIEFAHVKGEKGDTGEQGPKGEQGDSILVGQGDLPLSHVLGNDSKKAMSQKGLTKGLAGYVKMTFADDDLEEFGIENNTIGEEIQINTSSSFTSYRHGLYPVVAGQHGKITTIAGKSLLLAYCFVDANNIVLAKSSTEETHENEDFVVPEGAAYIGVNFNSIKDVVFSLDLYGVEKGISDIEQALEEVDDIKADVKEIQDVLAPQPTTYTASDLEVGQVNNGTVGDAYVIGSLEDFRHLIIPCVKGQTVTITTSSSTKSSSKIRGLAFADANNIVRQATPIGPISGEYEAPENSAFCIANCTVEALDTFSMEVTPTPTWMDELKKNVQDLRDDVDGLMNESGEEDIPLYHGKDMFFIKDIPLDFYAQSVLFKNYPKYKGVYVNCARDLSRRSTSDFSVPVIMHVCPTGKVYFKDGDIVGIYADNGKIYKDSWSAVTDITVHTTDLSAKQKSIKALFFGSSTTEYGLATYVKNYLNTLGVTVTCIGHKNDNLGTPSEGYAGWSNEMICGQKKTSSSAAISTSQFIRLATAEDKENYPDYCFKYSTSKAEGTSYTDASDKTGDFYIFDFAWFLETNSLETPDVVFFLLGINGDVDKYGTYMSWIVDRIMQACPNCKIGINVAQALRLQSDADEKIESNRQKFDMLYQYVAEKNSPNLKIVSCHCYQSPYFSHKFASESGENAVTEKVTMDMESDGGYLHMRNSGYQQIAKAIGAYIAYCLPDAE